MAILQVSSLGRYLRQTIFGVPGWKDCSPGGVVGMATWTSTAGGITNLVQKGCVRVTRSGVGTFPIILSPRQTSYTMLMQAIDDNFNVPGYYVTQTSAGFTSSGFTMVTIVGGGGVRDWSFNGVVILAM